MKKTKNLLMIALITLLVSCSKTIEFPVSEVAPAAEISVSITKQGKPNYLVTIRANHLAAPERLSTPKKIYVIWAVSQSGVVRNVGHFTQENAVKSTYKASFPYQPVEVFITAEDQEGPCLPEGTEISSVRLSPQDISE
jgi:hypothetical protein